LDAVPSDIKNPVFFDFEGKVHLLGYDLEPTGVIAPGTRVKLKLYWKMFSPVGPGVRIFTHLIDVAGRQVQRNLDDVGVLRGRDFGPSKWEPGKVYVDEVEFELDKAVRVSEVTIAVGLWRDMGPGGREDLRLDPIGGSADKERRALVARFKTGIVPPKALPPNRAPQPKS
jgi:hypothetical protein